MRDNSDKSDQLTGDEEQEQRSLIRSLFVEDLQSLDKDKMMAELFPKNDYKKNQKFSQDAKETVKEQGNIEAHGILMITDAVQCSLCRNDATLGHTFCKCGLKLLGPSEEVKKKFSRTSSIASIFSQQAHLFFFNLKVQREKNKC